jgi:hypothetical protein
MRDEKEILERDNALEMLAVLQGDNAPHPAAFMSVFTTVLARKINEDRTVSTGGTDLDKFERFFTWAFDVQRAPPIPYTAEELARFAEKARDTLLEESSQCADEGEGELSRTYKEDAVDHHKIAVLFLKGDIEGGKRAHQLLDTAARHWMMEAEGFETRRYYA